jgi:hypothetical protein
LSARENPRGGWYFHPPSSIRSPRWLRRTRPGAVPQAVRAGRNQEGRKRPNYESRSLKSRSPHPKPKAHVQNPGNECLTPRVPRFGRFPPFRRPPPQPRSPESDPRKPQPQPAIGPAGNDRTPPPPAQEPPRCPRHGQTVPDRPPNPFARIFEGTANDSPSSRGKGWDEPNRFDNYSATAAPMCSITYSSKDS